MAETSAALSGILERNAAAAAGGEQISYHLNHVEIELDVADAGPIEESAEGVPMTVTGSFETREHPESGTTRWVFKVSSVHQDAPGLGGELTGPPPSA